MRTKRNEEARLLWALKASAGLQCLGCKFHRGLTGGVVVTLKGRSIGIWKSKRSKFFFSETYLSEPVQAATRVDEALSITSRIAITHRQYLTV